MSQLSDENVSDLVLRAQMYKDILSDVESGVQAAQTHEVKEDEQYRSDLIAFRFYGRNDVSWLVDLMSSREDIAEPHVIGMKILLPESVYIRSKIKYYSTLEGNLADA